jgi:hypothetical protein
MLDEERPELPQPTLRIGVHVARHEGGDEDALVHSQFERRPRKRLRLFEGQSHEQRRRLIRWGGPRLRRSGARATWHWLTPRGDGRRGSCRPGRVERIVDREQLAAAGVPHAITAAGARIGKRIANWERSHYFKAMSRLLPGFKPKDVNGARLCISARPGRTGLGWVPLADGEFASCYIRVEQRLKTTRSRATVVSDDN